MPDYASILRRSVSALPDASPEMREAVYQRARAALARQLTAVDPPLSTRDIETQHQELEDAVVRLESEFVPQEAAAEAFADSSGKDDFLYTPQQPPPVERHAQPAGATFGHHHELGNEAPAAPPRFEEEDDDYDDDEERSSRLPLLIAVAAVLLVVIGAGAYVYAERATLFSFLNSKPAEPQVAAVDTAPEPSAVPAAPAVPEDPAKRPDRMVNGTDAAPPPPAAEAGVNSAAAVPTTPAPTEQAAVELPPTAAPLETGLDQGASQEQAGTNLVEQRAIYYYQGAEGQAGQASDGTATWAQITKDDRPAIQATLKIPQRNATVTVTIYKNYDSTLPASHLVEVNFNGKLSESAIQRVPALVLKQTEQARGQPLAGAAVPVTNELFWIALSNDQDEVVRNVQLLREGSWFDIPILFADQTRALITFEKGIPGDKVFETVMASWTPS